MTLRIYEGSATDGDDQQDMPVFPMLRYDHDMQSCVIAYCCHRRDGGELTFVEFRNEWVKQRAT